MKGESKVAPKTYTIYIHSYIYTNTFSGNMCGSDPDANPDAVHYYFDQYPGVPWL